MFCTLYAPTHIHGLVYLCTVTAVWISLNKALLLLATSYVHMCTHMHICTHKHYLYVCIHVRTLYIYTRAHVCTCTCTYSRTHHTMLLARTLLQICWRRVHSWSSLYPGESSPTFSWVIVATATMVPSSGSGQGSSSYPRERLEEHQRNEECKSSNWIWSLRGCTVDIVSVHAHCT